MLLLMNMKAILLLQTGLIQERLNVNWSIKVDALSSMMLVSIITLVSSLVHIYSIGYMSDDPHKPRFMAYLSLFTFAMLTLVTADNFLQLIFWLGRCWTLFIPLNRFLV